MTIGIKRFLVAGVVMAALPLAALATTAASAQATPGARTAPAATHLQAGQWVNFRSLNTGQCLQGNLDGTAEAVNCDYRDWQYWAATKVTAGQLVNQASGQCLDLRAGRVVTDKCSSTAMGGQAWSWVVVKAPVHHIVSNTGQCLAVAPSLAIPLTVQTCSSSSPEQQWVSPSH